MESREEYAKMIEGAFGEGYRSFQMMQKSRNVEIAKLESRIASRTHEDQERVKAARESSIRLSAANAEAREEHRREQEQRRLEREDSPDFASDRAGHAWSGEDSALEDEDEGQAQWLTQDQLHEAQTSLEEGDPSEVVVATGPPTNIDLTRDKMSCLENGQWLNDESINLWNGLIHQRNESDQDQHPKIKIMLTNFYSRMCYKEQNGSHIDVYEYNYVRRWTKKVDVFALDYVIVPLHQGMHWALAVVNFGAKRFEYYDSMGGRPAIYLANIKRWLGDESMNKKKVEFNFTGWESCSIECPCQENGYDCGVFMCQISKHIASTQPADAPPHGHDFRFSQSDMPMLRWQMVHEITNQHIL